NNVMPGGDVSILTPLDFGLQLTISKSVNITNDGAGEASILPPAGGVAIDIAAGPGATINLLGLVLDGQIPGGRRTFVATANAVHVQYCVIRNFQRSGSGFATGIVVQSETNMQVFISDTIIFNNGNGAVSGGLIIQPIVVAGVNVVLDRIHVENNVIGIMVDGHLTSGNGAHVILRDSVVSGNVADGVLARTQSGKGPAYIIVEHTSTVNNVGIGIEADGPRAVVILNDDTIARNGTGISAVNSGQIISFGNNK